MDEKHYTKAAISTQSAKADSDFIAVASTGVVDRHGEVVSPEGWDLKNFKADPVLLWAHDHQEMAVGQAKKVWIEGTGKSAKLMIEGFIHEATEKARALKYLVKEGIIKTMSVGFKPLDMDDNVYTKQELLEVSFVNVPANQQAQITALKSLRGAGFKDETIDGLGIPVGLLDQVEKLQKDVEDIQHAMKTVVKAQPSSVNPHQGRTDRVKRDRISMLKVIARAADKLAEADRKGLPKKHKTDLTKVIKRTTDIIIVAEKREL